MQDRYVGDVGDFGKYSLLRTLAESSGLKLGVAWYRVPNEWHNQDGKHISYLLDHKFAHCDQLLHQALRGILLDPHGALRHSARRINAIEQAGILPPDTVFHTEPLSYDRILPIQKRMAVRAAWIERALQATRGADLVFVDPDNGIECRSVSMISRKGPKYVYWSDLSQFADRGQSVLIYHHINRSNPAAEQIRALLGQLDTRLPQLRVSAVLFRRGTCRAYFLAAQEGHYERLNNALRAFLSSNWRAHFDPSSPDLV